jgi:hypothetical protein
MLRIERRTASSLTLPPCSMGLIAKEEMPVTIGVVMTGAFRPRPIKALNCCGRHSIASLRAWVG